VLRELLKLMRTPEGIWIKRPSPTWEGKQECSGAVMAWVEGVATGEIAWPT
jgi:hypothetical protein